MAKFKIKQLALAMGVALGGMSLLPSVQAVHLATDGQGQALIFPYYTVRGGWKTMINLTNTSDQVLAVKVRFHESRNTRDVFDFNVIMSPHDVWHGTVEYDAIGGARFSTRDNSCTTPKIFPNTSGVAFHDPTNPNPLLRTNGLLAFTGDAGDSDDSDDETHRSVDRMREGHIAVFLMGSASPTANDLVAGAIHNNVGNNAAVPADCAALVDAFNDRTAGGIDTLRAAFPGYATNPLKGAFSLVNPEMGLNATGSAVALANFRTEPYVTLQLPPGLIPGGALTDSFHEPTLAAADTAGQVLDDMGAVLQTGPANGVDAVSFVLQRATIDNQWAYRPTASDNWLVASDWIITFPTKRFYVDTATHEYAGRAAGRMGLPTGTAPFTEAFQSTSSTSCDEVTWGIFDREEYELLPIDPDHPPVFSPAPVPATAPPNSLCLETNVLTFNGSDVLKSAVAHNIQDLPGPNGWMRLALAMEDDTDTINGYSGLPAVSFAALMRNNSVINNGELNEAYVVDAAYTRASQ